MSSLGNERIRPFRIALEQLSLSDSWVFVVCRPTPGDVDDESKVGNFGVSGLPVPVSIVARSRVETGDAGVVLYRDTEMLVSPSRA